MKLTTLGRWLSAHARHDMNNVRYASPCDAFGMPLKRILPALATVLVPCLALADDAGTDNAIHWQPVAVSAEGSRYFVPLNKKSATNFPTPNGWGCDLEWKGPKNGGESIEVMCANETTIITTSLQCFPHQTAFSDLTLMSRPPVSGSLVQLGCNGVWQANPSKP